MMNAITNISEKAFALYFINTSQMKYFLYLHKAEESCITVFRIQLFFKLTLNHCVHMIFLKKKLKV